MFLLIISCFLLINSDVLKALVITNGPMSVKACSGTRTEISCDFSGAPDPFNTKPDWRIIKRSNDGHVISNETVNAAIIRLNKTDGLVFLAEVSNDNVNGRLLVGPVNDTYNNTSYQCIFTINNTIIESDTAGTVSVIGALNSPVLTYKSTFNEILVSWSPVDSDTVCGPVTYNITVMPSHGMIIMINDTVYNITGLNDDTNYTITVYASNNYTSGEPATLTVKTKPVPNPTVSITALNSQIVGQSVALLCKVTTVRSITSTVDIVWSSNGTELKRMNNVSSTTINSSLVYTDYYTISQLSTTDDDRVIQCEGVINANTPVMASDRITLGVTVPTAAITTYPFGPIEGAMVGSSQVINCTVSTVSGVESSSVMISWMGPGGVITNDDRVTVGLTFSGNTYTSSLQFTYLMEGDEGTYTCNVMILETNGSRSVELLPLGGSDDDGNSVGTNNGRSSSDNSNSDRNNILLLAAIIGGVIAILIAIIVIMVCTIIVYHRKKANHHDKGTLQRRPLVGGDNTLINSASSTLTSSSSSASNTLTSSVCDKYEKQKEQIALLDYATIDNKVKQSVEHNLDSDYDKLNEKGIDNNTGSGCDKYEKQKDQIALLDYATIDNKVERSVEHNLDSDYDKLNEKDIDNNTGQTTLTTVDYAVVDKSKKKEKVPQKEQKPYTDYDYPPIHIQYSSEKEVPQGEHNPYADYDYPPVVNKVTPVHYAELQNLPTSTQSYGVDKDVTTVYSQVV